MLTKRFYAQLEIYVVFTLAIILSSLKVMDENLFLAIMVPVIVVSAIVYGVLRIRKDSMLAVLVTLSGALFPLSCLPILYFEDVLAHVSVFLSLILFAANILGEQKTPVKYFENKVLLLFGLLCFAVGYLIFMIVAFINSPTSELNIASFVAYSLVISIIVGVFIYFLIKSTRKSYEELKDNSKKG